MTKTAVVTGGGTGFGKATAARLVADGWHVLITGRREETLRQAASEIAGRGGPGEIEWLPGDMADFAHARAAAAHMADRRGRIDAWINNAGAGVRIAPIDELDEAEIAAILGANLTTALAGCRAAIPYMKACRSGCIVNVASACAKHAWPGWSVYTAAKAGVVGLSRCLYTELRPHGVRVGTVVPGAGRSEFAGAAGLGSGDMLALQPEDVADAVYYMVSAPARAAVEELIVWGTDQEVVPL